MISQRAELLAIALSSAALLWPSPSHADQMTRGDVLVSLFNEYCLQTKGVEAAVADKAKSEGLPSPRRREVNFILADDYVQFDWDGSRSGVPYTVVTRGDRFCQIVSGPPAVPLLELSAIFGKAYKTRPVVSNPTVSQRPDGRHALLGFRVPLSVQAIGKYQFQKATDISVEVVTQNGDTQNILTLTN